MENKFYEEENLQYTNENIQSNQEIFQNEEKLESENTNNPNIYEETNQPQPTEINNQSLEKNLKEEEYKASVNKRKRNYGIDLLRISTMYLICLLHVLGRGGVLSGSKPQSFNYFLAWFLEIYAYCAVDCYALISGYVGIGSRYKYSNYIYLWLQVEYHSLGIMLFFALIKREMFSLTEFFGQAFPVTSERYWYFSAYTGLFLFMPYLNHGINIIPKNVAKWNLIITTLIITILSRFNEDFIYMGLGANSLSLIFGYVIGGYIKKYEPFKNVKNLYLIFIWIFMLIVTLLVKMGVELYTLKDPKNKGKAKGGGYLISYISPTIYAIAIIKLELFSRITFTKKPKILEIFAISSFGVYIIHLHVKIWGLLGDLFKNYGNFNPLFLVLSTLGTTLGIYLLCSLIDYLRYLLFEKIKLRIFLINIEEKFSKKFIHI